MPVETLEYLESRDGVQTREALHTVPRCATRSLTRCVVCGFSEIRTDTVVDREVIFLAECPRCDHRWTSATPFDTAAPQFEARRLRRVPARVAGEVAPAA